jgi:hypothetical protein
VGFSFEDILNITRFYSWIFLSINNINNPDVTEKIITNFIKKNDRVPTEEEIGKKYRSNLISFIRQSLTHCSIFCERKAQNILGQTVEKVYFAHTKDTVFASKDLIAKHYKELNYRQIDKKEVASLRKTWKNNFRDAVDSHGFKVVEIELFPHPHQSLFNSDYGEDGIEQYIGNRDDQHPAASSYFQNMSTEEKMIENEDDIDLSSYKQKFSAMGDKEQKKLLRQFISKNKERKNLKLEIREARRLLRVS